MRRKESGRETKTKFGRSGRSSGIPIHGSPSLGRRFDNPGPALVGWILKELTLACSEWQDEQDPSRSPSLNPQTFLPLLALLSIPPLPIKPAMLVLILIALDRAISWILIDVYFQQSVCFQHVYPFSHNLKEGGPFLLLDHLHPRICQLTAFSSPQCKGNTAPTSHLTS